ncbi:MAG TPA: HEAT repeat domain-containing protein [Candidatus Hydrogenedentes bacterium]|nr:HEAT repeat domain-containing protein [Candidatus Hydrogenedentota bacterium]
MKCLIICALATSLLAQPPSSMDAAFDALKTYTFGQSREALSEIDATVQAAYGDADARAQLEQRLADTILSGCTDDAARFVCRQLAVIGGEASVPALASLIDHETLTGAAIDALERNPSEAAGDALIAGLYTQNPRTKLGLVHALGARGDARAVDPLRQCFLADPRSPVAAAALLAVARIGGPGGRTLIKHVLTDGLPEVRSAAVDAYLVFADGLLVAGDTQGAWAIYDVLIAPAEAGHVRAAALRGRVRCAPEDASGMLLDAFESGDPPLQAAAAGLIRELPEDANLRPFVKRLTSLDAAGQLLLLDALANRRAPVDAAVFETLLAGEEAVQLAVIRAMPACGDERCAALLVDQAATGKGEVKRAARECLSAMPGTKVNAELLSIARGDDVPRAAEAVRVLGERGATEAAEPLMRLAKRAADPVCSEAWRALRNVAKAEDAPKLVAMLVTLKEEAARGNAERAVAATAARIADTERRAAAVIDALNETSDEAARASLLRALGAIATPDALVALRNALNRENEALRAVVVDALASWPDPAPAQDLLRIAENPSNDAERAKALEGCVRLMRSLKDKPAEARLDTFKALAALARDEAEKKRVLAALGDLPALATFDLIDALATDPALEAEAALAALNVAKVVWGAYPEVVNPRLETLAGGLDDNLRIEAQALLDLMPRTEDYITAWRVSGPLAVEGKVATTLFDGAEPPDDATAGWRIMPMGLDRNAPFVADLGRALGGAECVAFLRTFIHAPAAGPALLELGTNDGVKVWLNGALVHALNVGRALTPGEDKVQMHLDAGWNTLLLAVFQHGGDWAACARLRAPDGAPLAGLRTAVTPE